jgi:transposase
MNNRKTEVERITKEQLAAVEKCMTANKVNIVLRFNFDLTMEAEKVLEEKGYTLVKRTPMGFKLIIEKKEG